MLEVFKSLVEAKIGEKGMFEPKLKPEVLPLLQKHRIGAGASPAAVVGSISKRP